MAGAKDVAARLTEAFNAHDERAIRELYAPDAIFEAPGDMRLQGPNAIAEYAMSWLDAFSDARITVETEFVGGDWVAQRFVFEGTHDDTLFTPAGEIPATNRRLRGRGAELLRIVDGKIVEDQLYFDQMQLLMQLGVAEQAAAAR
jgi:predicted ester cyclase